MIATHEITDAIRASRAGDTPRGCHFSSVRANVVESVGRSHGESGIGERWRQQHAVVDDAERGVVHGVGRVDRAEGDVGKSEHGRAERDRHIHAHVHQRQRPHGNGQRHRHRRRRLDACARNRPPQR